MCRRAPLRAAHLPKRDLLSGCCHDHGLIARERSKNKSDGGYFNAVALPSRGNCR